MSIRTFPVTLLAMLLGSNPLVAQTEAEAELIRAQERAILVSFYHATGGPNWHNRTNWLSDLPVDRWHGIRASGTIDNQGRVNRIALVSNNLQGIIPSNLSQLVNIDTIGLTDNNLGGSIPSSLGNLNKLQVLNLGGNQLNGSIPSSLGNLNELMVLDLSSNLLSGTIPSSLGTAHNLSQLILYQNQLSGKIPPELARITVVNLHNNELTGTIPDTFGQSGKYLYVYGNETMKGPLPPSLFKNSTLPNVDIWGTQLCYPAIPEAIAAVQTINGAFSPPFCGARLVLRGEEGPVSIFGEPRPLTFTLEDASGTPLPVLHHTDYIYLEQIDGDGEASSSGYSRPTYSSGGDFRLDGWKLGTATVRAVFPHPDYHGGSLVSNPLTFEVVEVGLDPRDGYHSPDADTGEGRILSSFGWDFSVTEGGDWLQLTSPASGFGASTFTYSVSEHTGETARNGTITLTSDGHTLEFTVTQYSAQEVVGTVTLLGGINTARRGEKNITLSIGSPILRQDTLKTDNGFLRIEFSDGSSSNLGPRSELVIQQYDPGANEGDGFSLFNFIRGQILQKSGAIKNPVFNFPGRGSSGVRGTEYSASFETTADGITTLFLGVESGIVDFRSALTGELSTLEAGESLLLESLPDSALDISADAAPEVSFPTRYGRDYRLWGSDDLAEWKVIETITGDGAEYARPAFEGADPPKAFFLHLELMPSADAP